MPQKWQQQGFTHGLEHVGQSHIPQERSAGGASHVSMTCATYRVVTRDGSRSRHRSQTRTHVGGGETGEVAGEIEHGWAGSLVPKECCSGEN